MPEAQPEKPFPPGGLSGLGRVLVPEEMAAFYSGLTEPEQKLFIGQLKSDHLQKCRESYPVFGEYVLVDEKTRQPIKQAPVHLAWDKLIIEHNRVVLFSHVDSGKTQSITIGRVLWELGRNPSLRVVIVSNIVAQAGKFLALIAQYIEESDRLHEVFPRLRPSKKGMWQPMNAITVEREPGPKDPSVQAIGVRGNVIGHRCDLLLLDDALDFDNTRTDHQRREVIDWFSTTLGGRLDEESRAWSLGVPHHKKDLQHELVARGWKGFRFPVERDGVILHPRWTRARIEQAERDMGPLEASRQLRCLARSDEDAAFKAEDIQACIELGDGYDLVYEVGKMPADCIAVTGVDIAVSRKKKSDLTAIVTIFGHADGRRQLAMVETGRWHGREILQKIQETHDRYQSVVFVEDNASQAFLVQFAQEANTELPVRGFTTGMNKHQGFGIESIAAEMAARKWIIPSTERRCHPEVTKMLDELLYYDPNGHTGDRLSALWISKEGLRSLRRTSRPASLTMSQIRVGKKPPQARRGPSRFAPAAAEPQAQGGFHPVTFRERRRRTG